MFGSWYSDPTIYTNTFKNAVPYPHIVIENFLSDDIASELEETFPPIDNTWYRYWNPIEKKYAKNTFDGLSAYQTLFETLQTDDFVNKISQITGISGIEADPYLHGAGIHYHPRGGKLDMHLDYSIHPKSGKERRINIILYLNRDWNVEYGGDLQLWNSEFTQCEARISPKFNSAVIFRTSDISYHGLPTPITCPINKGRKSIAIYYVSDPRTDITPRYKAEFRPLPDQPVSKELALLYNIRRERIITEDILKEVYPNWEEDGNGYW